MRMSFCSTLGGSIPPISTKQVLDEHLLFQRRFRRQGNALILITKAPFREIKAVLLCFVIFNRHIRFIVVIHL